MKHVYKRSALALFALAATMAVVGEATAVENTNTDAAPPRGYPLQSAPMTGVQLTDAFWAPRLETNRKVTVLHNLRELEKQGSLGGFALLAGEKSVKYHGYLWGDSDVYKTMEGIFYCLRENPDPELSKQAEKITATIIGAQATDGYLQPHLQIADPKYKHYSNEENGTSELYDQGHLIESAIAHYELTGRRDYLDAAVKLADLICNVYGPGRREMPSGHPEIELALVRLYRTTQNPAYLNLAAYLIERTKHTATAWSKKPAMNHPEACGHAVAMQYLYCGAVDVAMLKDDKALMHVVEEKWNSAVGRKMYITGGFGYRPLCEAFPPDYELPNAENAYAETCAAVGNIYWQHRMFLARADGRYMDVLERALYNGFLAGVSLSGDRFFYTNPLESNGKSGFNRGARERFAWTDCPCCPTNIVRFLPTVPSLAYSTSSDALYVNLFIDGSAKTRIGETAVNVRQKTRYPSDGRVELTIEPVVAAAFTINVRIPGWARSQPVPGDLYRYDDAEQPVVKLAVNGRPAAVKPIKGYVPLQREWHKGDVVTLELPMPVRRVVAHPAVKADAGRFAVERGPLVYCAEGADNGGRVLSKAPGAAVSFETVAKPDMLGGIVTIRMTPKEKGDSLTLIPYYAWCHRGPNEMEVWFPMRPIGTK